MEITITEALAEVPTIQKRVAKKHQVVMDYLFRPSAIRDPLLKEGGSAEYIKREMQGIVDLEMRLVSIRRAIAAANAANTITIDGVEQSIQDWLTWRREIAAQSQSRLSAMATALRNLRTKAQQAGGKVVPDGTSENFNDYLVNVDEAQMSKDIERLETVLGALDGQLSLKNATIKITLP